ncbi:LamG-like jellyroll fold domain-containing protein [Bacteroidota bacterium]
MILAFYSSLNFNVIAQQINISRIEQMPNFPASYDLPNWKQIAIGYDSLVFDLGSSGEYLPVVFIITNTINYPNHNSFGIHSYVGSNHQNNSEAINIIPAVVGASLCGIDKSNQFGFDWVLMCEEYFNNREEEDVYLNNPNTSSGIDWWYDTMPNIFFYQLNFLYEGKADFDYQFIRIADRWLEAVITMGGSTTPWEKPFMNYRAWYLSSMTGNTSEVLEPEASGAIAWILYNAFTVTDNDKYRIAAEWALEFLNSLTSNPSYELQLSYGAYMAARMNAELNTKYDINKIINWCFDIGPLRNWGAIVGNWGGYDVNGLIGEVNGSNDYAFVMNTFEQIGALVPLVRYDDRYARAIGKWVLNAANSARLFYSRNLPDLNQDNEDWSKQYDPNSYIAYEGLRQEKWSRSPYATGDAIDGGWAQTNLGLYSSSHIGILGGIIDTTNVEKILKLDLLKTDYYHVDAYPSYLMYNPYSEKKTISYNLPTGYFDLYDAVSNKFFFNGVSDIIDISINGDTPLLIVEVPSGNTMTHHLNRTLANGVIIDYNSGIYVQNYPPRIKSLASTSNPVIAGSETQIFCTAEDNENDSIKYTWFSEVGILTGSGETMIWEAPELVGSFKLTVYIDDQNNGRDTSQLVIQVIKAINHSPQIEKIKALPRKIDLGQSSQIKCTAYDEDGDELFYNWTVKDGVISGQGNHVTWTAPYYEGNYYITCLVSDSIGGQSIDSIGIVVRDFNNFQSGKLIAHFPFNGNANDESENDNHGTVYGAQSTNDRFGEANNAYYFDGVDDYIKVANTDQLNFSGAITINFWMRIDEFFDREAYPISHGNWENRWKASITNNRLRWTVKTTDGIKDLDSETLLSKEKDYYVTLYYSGSDLEIYLNAELDAFGGWSGELLTTNIDLTIGQVLPNNDDYNFNGVIDDIRIFDYALSVNQIKDLYEIGTSVKSEHNTFIPKSTILYQNYPNPFNGQTQLAFYLSDASMVELVVYDLLGRKLETIVNDNKNPGDYVVNWNVTEKQRLMLSTGIYLVKFQADKYTEIKKIILLK